MFGMENKTAEYAGKLLLMKMERLSEDAYAAGWMHDIGFDIWRLAKAGGGTYGMSVITAEESAEFMELARDAGGWHEVGESELITPLPEWEAKYAAWEKARKAS